jgi:hypothetical protein
VVIEADMGTIISAFSTEAIEFSAGFAETDDNVDDNNAEYDCISLHTLLNTLRGLTRLVVRAVGRCARSDAMFTDSRPKADDKSVTLFMPLTTIGLTAESGDESELNAAITARILLARAEKEFFKVVKTVVIVFGSCGIGGGTSFVLARIVAIESDTS